MNANSAYRKAAILISALDAGTADLLLAEMPSDIAAAVRREVAELDEVDAGEQQAIIDEFVRLGTLAPEVDPPGLELNDELAARLAPAESEREGSESGDLVRRRALSHPYPLVAKAPFQSLPAADPGVLASVLEAEPAQIIAIVVANLPAHRAGDVLARLPSATQAEVIRRLAGLEQASREVLEDVERFVMARVRQIQPAVRRQSGLATVSAILNSSEEAARRQILSNLAVHDRPLAGKLKPSPTAPTPRFTFEEVCRLDTESLLKVVQAAPVETAVLAFAGTDAELVEDLIECLPLEQSQRFARGIAELGPTRLADIEGAQTSLAELASKLAADGRLHGGPPIHLTAVA